MQISNIQVIKELEEKGQLRGLIKAGYFPYKILYHMDIFYYVDAQIKSGVSKTEAVDSAHNHFNKDHRTIYRILKSMLLTFPCQQ
jgi:hypothetical protein